MTALKGADALRMGPASSRRRASVAAWVLATIALALGVLLAVAIVATSQTPDTSSPDPWLAVPVMLFFLSSPLIGALIVSRAQGNAIGWLLIASSGLLALGFLADTYATYARTTGEDLTLATVLRWAGSWMSAPAFGSIPLLALLFPDGRPASRRWRPLVWTSLGGMLAVTLSEAFRPDVIHVEGSTVVEVRRNPLGIPGDIAPLIGVVEAVGIALILGSALLATASLIVRFRGSRGVERQQLKWFVFGMATLAVLLVGSAVLDAATALFGDAVTPASDLLWGAAISSLALLPLGTGIAILRYHLYDIDVLINRTLVYGSLSASLGAAYVASVVLLQSLLRPFTAGSDIAVAFSTLAVVALFQPLRRRIQDAVDRRFYRARYDAQRTLDAFTDRMRDQVDLGDLEREMVRVVSETVRPTHASVWLRDPAK